MLQNLPVQDLRRLNFPAPADPQDTWKVVTDQGEAWIDRYSGQTLAWQGSTLAQRVYDWAVVLHTGEGAWPWAVVLGLVGACVLLFWLSGVVMWWQARRLAPHITGNSPLAQADVLIFVAREGGSTWSFAKTLQDALPLQPWLCAATHTATGGVDRGRHGRGAAGRFYPPQRPAHTHAAVLWWA